MKEIEGTITNDSMVPDMVLLFYAGVVLLPLSMYISYYFVTLSYIIPVFVAAALGVVSLYFGIITPLKLCYATRITRFTGRDIFIQERGLPLTLVKDKDIQVTWDNVLAWRDSHDRTEISGIEIRSIDLVIEVEGEAKLYRTSSDNNQVFKKHGKTINRPSYSFYNGKQIFFDEYKQRLKPLLDTIPPDHDLIDALRYRNTRKGDILRIIGFVLILGSFIVGFAGMASGVGLPALALGFPAGLYALSESRKYFKDVSK